MDFLHYRRNLVLNIRLVFLNYRINFLQTKITTLAARFNKQNLKKVISGNQLKIHNFLNLIKKKNIIHCYHLKSLHQIRVIKFQFIVQFLINHLQHLIVTEQNRVHIPLVLLITLNMSIQSFNHHNYQKINFLIRKTFP